MEPDEYCNVDLKQFGGHKDEVNCVAFSPDYEMLITGSDDRCVRVFNARTATLVCRLKGHTAAVRCVAVTNDSRHFASGSYDKTARVYRTRDAELMHQLRGHDKSVECMAFAHDGHFLTTGSWDKTARVWGVRHGRLLAVLRGHINLVQSVAINLQGNLLATGSWDYSIRVWTLPQFRRSRPVDDTNQSATRTTDDVTTLDQSESGHPNDVIGIPASNDPIVEKESRPVNDTSSGGDGDVATDDVIVDNVITSVRTGSESPDDDDDDDDTSATVLEDVKFIRLLGHSGNIHSVAFSRAGMLASGSWDKSVRLWNPRDGRQLHVLIEHTGWIRAVSFTLDGFYCASVGDDEAMLIWDVVTGECCRRLQACSDTVHLCGFSQGGALVATGASNTAISFR